MKTRVISAVVGVLVLVAIYIFGKTQGLYAICAIAVLGGLFEYTKLAFKDHAPLLHLRITFALLTAGVFATTALSEKLDVLVFTFSTVVFFAMTLLTVESKEDLEDILHLQSRGLLGFLYCGIMPGLATRLLLFDQGHVWLFGLLSIVFAGDTCAYLIGSWLGKTRLLEAVSPKKSLEGAIGGLLGSAVAGATLSFFLPGQSPLIMAVAAVCVGVFAQVGDLFESLLKRVADVKDSGALMPGHGGFLDRLDGVFFAAPIYYILAIFLTGR